MYDTNPVAADYYDGVSSRRIRVQLTICGDALLLTAPEWERREPLSRLRLSERLGAAPRIVSMGDGARLELPDSPALDAWLREAGFRTAAVDRAQRSWLIATVSLMLFVMMLIAGYRWGLPVLSSQVAERMPREIVESLGQGSLDWLDRSVLEPSALAPDRQQAVRSQFAALIGTDAEPVEDRLLFRSSPKLGANALTLPDGRIVVLDALVALAASDSEVCAVLAHEWAHVQRRHHLRQLVQASVTGAVLAWWIGDFSSIAAAAPAAALQAGYSRDLEQQADDDAARLLIRSGQSPELLVTMLEKLEKAAAGHGEQGHEGGVHWLNWLASHPDTPARIQRLRNISP